MSTAGAAAALLLPLAARLTGDAADVSVNWEVEVRERLVGGSRSSATSLRRGRRFLDDASAGVAVAEAEVCQFSCP